MEYLVTMTTHVPDGTPGQAVDDARAREALPLDPWMTTELTPLTPHPGDPATVSSRDRRKP